MRIRHRRRALLVCLLSVATACGGSGDVDGAGEDAPAPAAAARTGTPPDLSNAGTIVVSATFSGEVPPGEPLDMGSDPACERSSGPRLMRPVTINEDGTLRSILVYISEGLEGMAFPDPGPPEPVFGFDLEGQLTQSGCLFRPRVLATRTNQAITLRNSDEAHHRATAEPLNNPAFSANQAMTGMEMQHSFPHAEVGIAVRCEVHAWMRAVIHVFDHPYFTVLGEDNRRFELDPLPPGEYVLEARHETLGIQTMRVTVSPAEATEVNFAFGM